MSAYGYTSNSNIYPYIFTVYVYPTNYTRDPYNQALTQDFLLIQYVFFYKMFGFPIFHDF